MIKIENVILPSTEQWRAIILGARNAMNSWDRSDSKFFEDADFDPNDYPCGFKLGSNDYNLLRRLAAGGSTHAKYRRMITVYADVTAPLYWWKEADTYRMGVEKNSCSTMHKIADKEFTLEDFSCEHLMNIDNDDPCDALFLNGTNVRVDGYDLLRLTINVLNYYRNRYIKTKNKKYWWQMIQLLPSSYNQKRTVMLNYEVLAHIYKDRKYHKLDEWREHYYSKDNLQYENTLRKAGFCDWIKTLPYPELICGEHINKEETTPDCFVPMPGDK